MIPRLSHIWCPGPYPYDLFVGTSLYPGAPHSAVWDVSEKLQIEGKLTPEVRLAWDELRCLPNRLAIDFFLYNPQLADDPLVLAQKAVQQLASESRRTA